MTSPITASTAAPSLERRSRIRRQAERPCQRTLIVGTDETARRLASELKTHFPDDFLIVGFVADEAEATLDPTPLVVPDPTPGRALCNQGEITVVGAGKELSALVRQHRIDRVMFANCLDWQLENTGFQVRGLHDLREVPVEGRLRERRREVSDLYIWATSPAFRWPRARRARLYGFCNRAFDIAFSLAALTASLPLALLLFPIIKLTSPGPIFYIQERVGRGGQPFTIYKLRTMSRDAERETGPTLSPHGDTRSTALGRFLRATKLDEVPQFWNVLKGDMSIVGPRPERPHFVDPFSSHIYSYSLRHTVRPGLTGLAQIKGDHLTHVYVKLHYDLIYACHRSLLLDLAILARTPLTIVRNIIRRPPA